MISGVVETNGEGIKGAVLEHMERAGEALYVGSSLTGLYSVIKYFKPLSDIIVCTQ